MSAGTWPAKYDGYCLACEEKIYEGDMVKWADGTVIHADCSVYDDRMVEVPPTCPRCHEVPAVNGTCGCD